MLNVGFRWSSLLRSIELKEVKWTSYSRTCLAWNYTLTLQKKQIHLWISCGITGICPPKFVCLFIYLGRSVGVTHASPWTTHGPFQAHTKVHVCWSSSSMWECKADSLTTEIQRISGMTGTIYMLIILYVSNTWSLIYLNSKFDVFMPYIIYRI